MSTFAPITLDTKVYTNSDITGGIARWMERSGGAPASFSPLTLQVKPPAAGVRNYRVTAKIVIPVVQAADSACGCAGDFIRQDSFEVVYTTSNTSTTAERTHALAAIQAFMANAVFSAAVISLEPVNG